MGSAFLLDKILNYEFQELSKHVLKKDTVSLEGLGDPSMLPVHNLLVTSSKATFKIMNLF